MTLAVHVNGRDNVATVTEDCAPGTEIPVGETVLTAATPVPRGHKIALKDFAPGEDIVKYGVVIGRAAGPIARGAHVHTHNVDDITRELCDEYTNLYRERRGDGNLCRI